MRPALQPSFEEQQDLILQAAASCIEASSLLDFTMASIAREARLSMGSIYKHIQCKEDVLVALGHRSYLHFEQVVRRVLSLPLPIAARIIALQLVDAQHTSPYRFGSQLITLLGNDAILRRASPDWLEKYRARDLAVEALFQQHFREAAKKGELLVEASEQEALVNEISTATWSLCVGHAQVMRQRNGRTLAQDSQHLALDSTIVRALLRLLNAYPWRSPLSPELLERSCRLLAEQGLRQRYPQGV